MPSSRPKVFVSHSVSDWDELVSPLVKQLLKLGCDLPRERIFCSSMPGTIKNGEAFVKQIFEELKNSDLFITLLSPNFLRSEFCLAELGAARLRQLTQKTPFPLFTLIVPPTDYGDLLKGVLLGAQSGRVDWPATHFLVQ